MNAITRPPAPEPIVEFKGDYGFLSNFHRGQFTLNDWLYPTAEHAFQAQKTLDYRVRAEIAALPTPQAAKAAGQRVQLRTDWEQIKKQVMLRVVMAKFARNPTLATQLAATADADLVEGNLWHDNFWGNCYCQRPRCAPAGLNYLGRILMTARFILHDDAS